MMPPTLNYRSLLRMYRVFRFRVWLHRSRMIFSRLALALVTFLIVWSASRPVGLNSSGSVNLGWVFILPFLALALWCTTIVLMASYWQRFARDNNARLAIHAGGVQPSNSFTKRLSTIGFMPIAFQRDGFVLYVQPTLYKSGGILRWREYKMDLALRYEPQPPVLLPHVIADATPRDTLKGSNLHNHFPGYTEFRAEGDAGNYYRLLAEPQHTTDALVILSPDTLQTLLGQLPGADAEFQGDSVWFLYRNFAFTAEKLDDFFRGGDASFAVIRQQLHAYLVPQDATVEND